MKKYTLLFGCIGICLLACGCHSTCGLSAARPDVAPCVQIDGGEQPLSSFFAVNMSYQLFGCIPLVTGNPWRDGNIENCNDCGINFFEDNCTLDNNIVTLRSALKHLNTNRISNLNFTYSKSSKWSFGLCSRKVIKTTCLILAPKAEEEQEIIDAR